MNTGMLWFDNDPKVDLQTKITRAADYYKRKYGTLPDLCYVHPSMLKDVNGRRNGIDVRPNQRVLPNHFWLGVQEKTTTLSMGLENG